MTEIFDKIKEAFNLGGRTEGMCRGCECDECFLNDIEEQACEDYVFENPIEAYGKALAFINGWETYQERIVNGIDYLSTEEETAVYTYLNSIGRVESMNICDGIECGECPFMHFEECPMRVGSPGYDDWINEAYNFLIKKGLIAAVVEEDFEVASTQELSDFMEELY